MADTVQNGEAETFARVWKRVQEERGPSCPIQPTAAERGTKELREISSPLDDLPLGRGSGSQGDFLRGQIQQELRRWQSYGRLAAGIGSMAALSRGALRRARRLSAAWLLISGVRFLPLYSATPMTWACREEGLCVLFRQEQLAQMAYTARAKGNPDPELGRLFLDLAEDCAAAQRAVRRALEDLR